MPKFLDVHPLKGLDEETLRKLQTSLVDEFKVKPLNLIDVLRNYERKSLYDGKS